MIGQLIFRDGTQFEGESFGAEVSTAGELVFSTGMVGYPEAFTDPSFEGQILILTYPIIGSYGVSDPFFFESKKLHIKGLIVSDYIDTPSHFQSKRTLGKWLKDEKIPSLIIKDTRYLAQKIRDEGTQLGKVILNKEINWYDPHTENLVANVSTKNPYVSTQYTPGVDYVHTSGKMKTVVLIDCGTKRNIERCLIKRGVQVITIPWDFNPFQKSLSLHLKGVKLKNKEFDALVISNGPGDPKMADKTIEIVKKAMSKNVPILGICLGNQILALAAGGDTSKLKFGHRSQNQPCIQVGTKRCYITTQNHGFHVSKIPQGFKPWFINANDNTNEGIIHKKLPFMSVQFHPEATPGPEDTEWIFDFFLEKVKGGSGKGKGERYDDKNV